MQAAQSINKIQNRKVARDYMNEGATETFEGEVIKLVHITMNESKPAIVIECGINAREWISPTFCLYTMKKLIEGGENGTLKNFQFYIVPVLNPDGYRYTWSGVENRYVSTF